MSRYHYQQFVYDCSVFAKGVTRSVADGRKRVALGERIYPVEEAIQGARRTLLERKCAVPKVSKRTYKILRDRVAHLVTSMYDPGLVLSDVENCANGLLLACEACATVEYLKGNGASLGLALRG